MLKVHYKFTFPFPCHKVTKNIPLITTRVNETIVFDPPFLLAETYINTNRTHLSQKRKVKKVASLIFDVTSDVSAAGNHTNPVGIFDLVKGGQCHIVLQV